MNHLTQSEYKELLNELGKRYEELRHCLDSRTPKDKLDGAAVKKYWTNPDNIKILLSDRVQRQRAVADMKVILAQISGIK